MVMTISSEGASKPVRLSVHARQQIAFRGATEAEPIEAIRNAKWEPAKKGRWECRLNLSFEARRNEVFYRTKQVRPIFLEEDLEIVVVTVYVYYF